MISNFPKLVILVVLDGWGQASPGPGNAISLASTINMDRFWASYPHTSLIASGEPVGLPRSEAGNTETGHLNLGAGKIVYQDLLRINMAIADGSFYKNTVLLGAFEKAKNNNSSVHLMGLVGAAGVHSSIEHLFALIELSVRMNFKNLYLHIFTDGRDSPPTSSKTYIQHLREVLQKSGVGQIASIMGRYWAMDRDLRWDRTAKAYSALTKGSGLPFKTPEEAIDNSYHNGKTDEFIEPSLIVGENGKPIATIKDGDSVVFFNFRIDRPRQLSRAFVLDNFSLANMNLGFDPYLVNYQKKHSVQTENQSVQSPFTRGEKINNLYFVTMTEYEKILVDSGAAVAFPPEIVDNPLGRVISEAGLRQLRASESEKQRFVTFYFNGQRENAFSGEETLIIPSPKEKTYDLIPEMSARQLTDSFLERMRSFPDYKFILINYANSDMVAHTGSIGATARACEVVDECLGKLANWVLAYDGSMLITADHGNAEEMINSQTGEIDTEHNANPVPFIAIAKYLLGRPQTLQSGVLLDVAPTILKLLNLPVPRSMTGSNLLESVW